MSRYKTVRRDANHHVIVAAYEKLFCSVIDTSMVGFGFPDLVIGCAGITELVEVKTEEGGLESSQERFVRDWRGSKVRIVRSESDVADHVTTIRSLQARKFYRPENGQ